MKTYKPFSESYNNGIQAENRIMAIFNQYGYMAKRVERGASHDIEVNLLFKTICIEVKNEDNYAGGPNICIEVRQGFDDNKRPSGLAITRASFYIHTFKTRSVIYKVPEMKEWIRQKSILGYIKIESFGDNSNEGYIIPSAWFSAYTWYDRRDTKTIPESPLLT